MTSPKDNDELRQKIDDIVFRCFAQGQYWGSGLNKDPEAFDEDYRPENPIDRTEAVKAIEHLVSTHVVRALERVQDKILEVNGAYIGIDGRRVDNIVSHDYVSAVIKEELAHLNSQRKGDK